MTKHYRIRGIEQDIEAVGEGTSSVPSTSTEIDVKPLRRLLPSTARDAGVIEAEVAADEVVRVEYENGFVLWSRADDLLREHGRKSLGRDGSEVWEIVIRPPLREGKGSTRGWLGIGIKVLDFFGVKLKDKVAVKLGEALEKKLLRRNDPGLYRCSLKDAFSLSFIPETESIPASTEPVLLFIHGTGSSCEGSFGKLWKSAGEAQGEAQQLALSKLRELYADRVYAWEHRSLTQSPIQNALELVEQLPEQTPIHLVTHSRGGLVGELLCLVQRDDQTYPLKAATLKDLFASDRTMAEQLGLRPLDSKAAKERDAAYASDRMHLNELLERMDSKRFTIDRFVRVACPARGTTLASGRLDRWLSVLDFVSGNGLFGDVADFLLAVVKERTDPRTLPGLEAMMPGSALIRLLHLPDLLTTSDLTVIAGDIEGESLLGQIKLLLVDWFYGADHDLVVNTGSMYGGLLRPDKGARFLRDQADDVNHFNYFTNDETVRWLVNGLTRSQGSDGGFLPIREAKHEAPKWREAVRRSRTKTTPQPLAVVLPGTMGSALDVQGKDVWLDYWQLLRGGLKRLRIGAIGVEPTEILDDFYGPLLEFLARSHRVEIFAYDWRLSIQDAAAKLADKLQVWLPDAECTKQPVHLVAHSMGGLVVRAMLADVGPGAAIWQRIKALPNSRFMMLGTPNQGSYEAMRWLTGYNPTELKLSLLDFTQNTNDIIEIVHQYPGLLELLPCADDDPDFSQQSLWKRLKDEVRAGWTPPDAELLSAAKQTWSMLKSSALDPEYIVYIAGHQGSTVTDYQLFEDPHDPLNIGRKKLDFIGTRQGDGTVTWKSGMLSGVKTWYVEDTAHDELCKQKRAFPGYLDLLVKGSTSRLHETPPGKMRTAESDRFSMPQTPFTDDLPDERSVRNFSFGPSRPPEEDKVAVPLPLIRVSITHGDLAYAKHHVLVGHYQGDSIVSAEAELDARLDRALTHRLQLGIYPGPLDSHAFFFNQNPRAKPAGALVIGLGQVGELSPGLLESGIRSAILNFALQMFQRKSENEAESQGIVSVTLSCMLVGSGAGAMSLRDSIESILRGAVAANDKLVSVGLDNKVLIDEIEFLELYEDVSILAAKALKETLTDGQLATAVEWPDEVVVSGQGGHRRVRYEEAPDWWHRLEIIEEKGHDRLRFIATTDRARAEVTQASGQLLLADAFIQRAIQSPGVNADLTKTLFEILLPNRLKELAPRQTDLVLLVDELSARYPWELLEDRWSHTSRPPSVAAGLIRQLKTREYRPVSAHAFEAKALVVGNPDLEGWPKFPDLPGARQEAQRVTTLLTSHGFLVKASIDGKADKIIEDLHSDAWRILHLAGHGEHEYSVSIQRGSDRKKEICVSCGQQLPEQKTTASGMVIGYNTFLTPGDVKQMRWVPELVFINCCHLGKTQSSELKDYNILAANLAMQFIRMGVKAVVAAGWAVDDDAALAFAESFYTHLLDGYTFGEAVRAAREAIWKRFPDVNTWGAYQCYGDPSYCLRSDGNHRPQRESQPFHSAIELIVELQNLTESIRMESRKSSDNADTLNVLRQHISSLNDRIPDNQKEAWRKRGDVASAYGLAWGEAGAYAEAIEWLERALKADKAELPVRAIEQYANFQVRHAGEAWQQILSAKAQTPTKKQRKLFDNKRQDLIEHIEKAILLVEFLCERGATIERLNLLGSAYKRLALLHDDEEPRQKALAKMAEHYRHAYDADKVPNPYPFTNWSEAQALISRGRSKQQAEQRLRLRDECRQMLEIVQKRADIDPNFWNSVAQPDLDLVLLLAQTKLTAKQARERAEFIIEGYRNAFKRGASPREMASVRENIDFIIALSSSAPKSLRDALSAIRAAI